MNYYALQFNIQVNVSLKAFTYWLAYNKYDKVISDFRDFMFYLCTH